MDEVPVEIWQLVRDEAEHDVILLRDSMQHIVLPIVIGICEAAAIWVALSPDMARPYVRRPWSHDLMQAMLERLGAQLDRVVIDGYENGAFLSTIYLRYRGGEIKVAAKPSDAIALLTRMPAPLLVGAEILSEKGLTLGDEDSDMPDFGEGLL